MRKRWRVIVAVVAGFIVLLLFVVPYLINVDNYRPAIESALASSLGRPVEIGRLRLSLASGSLTAENISIADDETFSRSPFLRAETLKVGVEVWPLLTSRVLHVRSLTIEKPLLNLLRSPSGRWNFASLGGKEKSGSRQKTRDTSGSSFGNFSVEELRISSGRLAIGRASSGGVAQSYQDVSLKAANISPTTAFPLTFSANTPGGGKLKLQGTAGPIDPNSTMEHVPVHVKFSGQKLPVQDVEGLLEVLGVALPAGSSLRGGMMNAELAVDGPLDRLVTTGPLSVSNVTFSGFSLASKLGAMRSFGGGAQSSSDTLIQSMSSNLRLAQEGIRAHNVDIVIPALGTITGNGTISPSNALNFRMVAKLNAGANALALKGIPGLGQGGNGLPFRIQGTTSNPVFLPDVVGALGGGLPVPMQGGQGLDNILGELTGRKKK